MDDKILFDTIEPLSNHATPSHACCSECGNIKPIEDFKRKATKEQAFVWGWDKQRDRKDRTYTGKSCNDCYKAMKRRPKPFDYSAYNKKLHRTGRYEYLVPHPDTTRTKNGEPIYITQREAMIWHKRAEGQLRKQEGGRKALRSRFAKEFAELQRLITNELARVKAQLTRGTRTPLEGVYYLRAYDNHLRHIRRTINLEKQAPLHPKLHPSNYINTKALATIEARELFRNLSGEHKELVAKKYL